MQKRLSSHMARALIHRAGGIDAACAAIEAETGEAVSRGTLSKIQNGHLDIPFTAVVALQKATGDLSFLRYLARSAEGQGDLPDVTHIETLRESNEAVLAQALAETDSDPEKIAAAIKESEEAAAAHSGYAQLLKARLSQIEGGAVYQ